MNRRILLVIYFIVSSGFGIDASAASLTNIKKLLFGCAGIPFWTFSARESPSDNLYWDPTMKILNTTGRNKNYPNQVYLKDIQEILPSTIPDESKNFLIHNARYLKMQNYSFNTQELLVNFRMNFKEQSGIGSYSAMRIGSNGTVTVDILDSAGKIGSNYHESNNLYFVLERYHKNFPFVTLKDPISKSYQFRIEELVALFRGLEDIGYHFPRTY